MPNARKITKNKLNNYISEKHWRIYVLVFFVLAGVAIITARIYSLQITNRETYRAIAENQHEIMEQLNPNRGEIYLQEDSELYPLAINREYQMVYAIPKEIQEKEKAVLDLASVLEIDAEDLRNKLSDPNDVFEILKHKISGEEIDKIRELNMAGINFAPESFRYYPAGEMAAQVVGFVGSDGKEYKGRYGIESFWDEELAGKGGVLKQEKDAGGRWISVADRELNPAQNGADLVLTINRTVQYEVEKVLRESVERHGADNGTIIVMEPKTGRILAMANFPTFNPNDYSKAEDMNLFLNPAVSLTYECGSVFKPVTMAAAINDGKAKPDTSYVDNGSVKEAGYTIKNSDEKVYGRQTMTQVLENSINTGAIYAEKLAGNRRFADYVRDFGFGGKTGIGLPAESAGNINNLKNLGRNIQFFTASFGQGISVTPLQLINAYSTIASGGKLMKPQIVAKIIYPGGEEKEIEPEEVRQVISEDTARKISLMLRSVVVSGHGKQANVPGYLVGGKTGTAQVAKLGEKGYEENVTVGSFAGYAPIDDPQFAVLVKIYNPKDVQWAESTAAPVFGKVMKFLLGYYKVKPTEENELTSN